MKYEEDTNLHAKDTDTQNTRHPRLCRQKMHRQTPYLLIIIKKRKKLSSIHIYRHTHIPSQVTTKAGLVQVRDDTSVDNDRSEKRG